MENNLEFWDKYKEVPKNALKDFNNGKFKGTDINTMWRLKCLTETFGMCGFGWYFKIKDKWTEKTEAGDEFAFVEIELFVKKDGEWSMPISGTGGNKLLRVTKDGELSTSDEAFKMAVTDAIGVACRNLGIGADVYWANDKTKYTEYQTKPDKLDDKLVKELEGLGGTLEVVASLFKIEVGDLTNDQIKSIIEKKKRNLKAAKGEQGGGN